MRITKREMFEKLGLEVIDDLASSQNWFRYEEGEADILITIAVFRMDDKGKMTAEVMENYYNDCAANYGFRECLFHLAFVEINAHYVGFEKMIIRGEDVDLQSRQAIADGLSQFRGAVKAVSTGKRPVFITASEKELGRNFLDGPWKGNYGGGSGGFGAPYSV